MGKLFLEFVTTEHGLPKYVCNNCGCDVATEKRLIWEGFMNAGSPAYLFKEAVNVAPTTAAPRYEVLSTGGYLLLDVGCRKCSLTLGWQYLRADKLDQHYKVGCCLLHQASLLRVTGKAVAPEDSASEASEGDVSVALGYEVAGDW
ncbi:hypothetical protein N2152v2_003931 [Parachlorella kessleri]